MDGAEVIRRPPFGSNPQVGERGASTQRRILTAALDVFAEAGFHDTSVELITKAAECSRPSFYQYFSSKEDVFWRLAGHLAKAMGELAEQLDDITPDDQGVEPLRAWLTELIDLCDSYAPVFAAFGAAMREHTPITTGSRGISEHIGKAIIRNMGKGRPELEIQSLAITTVTTILRSIHYWRIGVGQLPRARFVDGLAQTLHRVLHGPIEGVNMGPVIEPPTTPVPHWPVFPGMAEPAQPLRARGQKTRQTLLDAGTALLPKRGYHETRVDDIVEAAGVSHGSFYRYFDNKDDLFHVLAQQAASHMVELVDGFPEVVDADRLHDWLQHWFASYRANGGVISAWADIDYDDPALATFSLDIARVVLDRLGRIVHRRGFGDSTVDALSLLSIIERVPYSVLALGYVEESDAIDASLFLIQRGLFGLVDPPGRLTPRSR